MNKTSIEWTHRPGTVGMTWNPIRARRKSTGKTGTFCTKISPGCKNCYASGINKRFGTGLGFEVPNLEEHEFFIDQRILQEPLKQKKPATIFVGDMFDLFHEAISAELIEEVLLVMVQAKQHTFQLLTKRAERMQKLISSTMYRPHPHIWFGVSVENRPYADERIPFLLRTPAAIRFLSVEPLLEDLGLCLIQYLGNPIPDCCAYCSGDLSEKESVVCADCADVFCSKDCEQEHRKPDSSPRCGGKDGAVPGIDWCIVGGESGPSSRPFQLEWAKSLLEQCQAANVPFFMKQVGSKPYRLLCGQPTPLKLTHGKGGNPDEWPGEYRVREFPR